MHLQILNSFALTLAAFLAAARLTALVAAPSPSPAEALKRMLVAQGFEVQLVASEPGIRQPVTTSFDERGAVDLHIGKHQSFSAVTIDDSPGAAPNSSHYTVVWAMRVK